MSLIGLGYFSELNESELKSKKDRYDNIAATLDKRYSLPSLMITKSVISIFSWEEMQRTGVIKITNSNLEGIGSVNDPRMGGTSSTLPTKCSYCGENDCPGHYGLIEFGGPIYNPMFIRDLVSVLTSVCNDCGSLLITEDLIRQKGWMNLSLEDRLSAIEEYCKGFGKCLKRNPQIGNGYILSCKPNPTFITTDIKDKGEITYKIPKVGAKKVTKDDEVKCLMISEVINIFNLISDSDAKLLGFNNGNHPRNMLLYGCLVPPTITRLPLYESGNKREDKLTLMFAGIKRKVDAIRIGKAGVDELYTVMKQLIYKSEPNKIGIKDFRSIIERIQGKDALIRGSFMGKRGNYTARTVASPDSSLEFGEIRLPRVWASELTKQITVTSFNKEYLQNLFDKGQIEHKISQKTGLREFIRDRPNYKLQIGETVERWLQEGDRVIINRQPTLHRQSKMAYRVVFGDEYSIGLHLSYTTPMNCDFDGDENNAWLPRHFEVEAEAEIIMNVKNNIMSTEYNRPIMGLVMNSITSAYLLTKSTVSSKLAKELLDMITINDKNTFQNRLIKWGIDNNSGSAIFSSILPPSFYYNQKGVIIINGILISGRLKKSSVGASHRSIIQDLHKKYGAEVTSDFFTNASWLLNKWILERGFSVGLLDMINLQINNKTKKEEDCNIKILKRELAKIYNQLETLATKLDDPLEEQFRRKQIVNLSNITTGIGVKLADEVLTPDNSIAVMTEKGAGTKGAVANIGQMMGAVGQQFIYGDRITQSITGGKRALPTHDEGDSNPEAHGFIPTSFFTGLDPESLFYLQAGGRPSLLDTALKTQETGALEHRMVKAFENVTVTYDGSVRNAIGTVFATMYNSGYDVGEMLMVGDYSSFVDIKSLSEELNINNGWIPKDIKHKTDTQREKFYPEVKTIIDQEIIEELNIDASSSKEIFYPEIKTITNEIVTDKDISEIKIKNNSEIYIHPITKFEKSRIIGTRSMQLNNGATPIIKIIPGVDIDPVNIALKEYETGKLQLYVVRKFTDGSYHKMYPTLENQRVF